MHFVQHVWVYIFTHVCKPGRELEGLEGWGTVFVCVPETGIHYCGGLEMIIYSICVYVFEK